VKARILNKRVIMNSGMWMGWIKEKQCTFCLSNQKLLLLLV
jgi:hypothetical protein